MDKLKHVLALYEIDGWLVDLTGLSCLNISNGITVKIFIINNKIKGRIDDLPERLKHSLSELRKARLDLPGLVISAIYAFKNAAKLALKLPDSTA